MVLLKVSRTLAAFFSKLDAKRAVMLLAIYTLVSYWGLYLSAETELTSGIFFFYWLIVTASTVGYGDASPGSVAGQLVTSIWVIPIGISLFAMIVTKAGLSISNIIHKNLKGFGVTNHKNHIVIIGWNGQRTLRLLNLLLDDNKHGKKNVELYVTDDIDNPMPKAIDMIRVDHFTEYSQMCRGGILDAQQIIIDTESDDVTVTTALFCSRYVKQAHITAYLKDDSTANILAEHCPTVEIVPDVSVEMLAKATLDRGSSSLHKELLDSTSGETQYSFVLGEQGHNKTYLDLLIALKTNCAATIIGYKDVGGAGIVVNAPNDLQLHSGNTIYYIADNRLTSLEIENGLGV